MLASAKGDLEMVQELLGKGEDVKAQNKIGKTALIFAASEGHTKVVEALLKAGADPKQKDKDGATASTRWLKKAGHMDVVKLLEAKAVKK
jgi:ankyrin repeat protein